MRVHLFPSRTQKLSSCTPTILGGRLPGKIGNANTKRVRSNPGSFFCLGTVGQSTCFRLRCPTKSSGLRIPRFCRPLHTLRSRCIRRRRRLSSRPSRTQKLSSCTPTILGGPLLRYPAETPPDGAGSFLADRCHSLTSLYLPPAALGSLPREDR